MDQVQDQEMRTQFFAATIGQDLINRQMGGHLNIDQYPWKYKTLKKSEQQACAPILKEMAMIAVVARASRHAILLTNP